MTPLLKTREGRGGPLPAATAVLIVDDSAIARAVLSRVIGSTPGFEVAECVADVPSALRYLAGSRVGIVVLDLNMPGVSGLVGLPDILAAGRGARVLVVSSACEDGAVATVHALALGAADTLEKPEAGGFAGKFVTTLRDRLERLAVPRPANHAIGPPATRIPSELPSPVREQPAPAIVAIGASTGGIHALSQMLRAIPPGFTAPILITQHLPGSFMPYFAAQVALLANRPCDVAIDRMRVLPGRAIVAPGDAHIRCVRTSEGVAIRLHRGPTPSGCTPSADPMFASVAEVWRERAVAVVLSGMGRDGAQGAQSVAAAGGTVLAQDRASSVVWGMPGAVAAAGIATAIANPDILGRMIVRMGAQS